jgi:hypothetical protein
MKFHQNPSSGSGVVPCGQTDRHEANSRFPQFCERASNVFWMTRIMMNDHSTVQFNATHNTNTVNIPTVRTLSSFTLSRHYGTAPPSNFQRTVTSERPVLWFRQPSKYTRFQTTAAVFGGLCSFEMLRRGVGCQTVNRRFGTNYRSHLQLLSRIIFRAIWPDMMSLNVGNQVPT